MISCCKCKENATWMYMPTGGADEKERDRYYCDDCVSRGCSCNLDFDTGEELTDDMGRKLPCCEYNYSEDGFEEESK